MNSMMKLLAAGLAATLPAGGAMAQALEYDCDTQAEHYSVLKAVQDGPSYSAGGTISPRALFGVKKYVTLGMLEMSAADGSWKARIGITGLAVDKKSVLMGSLEITRNGKQEPEQQLGEFFEFELGKSYPISLTFDADGGTATLGEHSVRVNLPASGKVEASVICSGGEFLFTGLRLGG